MKGIALENLSVTFNLSDAKINAVFDVDTLFENGKITGIIGESGCGKSVLGLAIMGLLPPYATITGNVILDGEKVNAKDMNMRLGKDFGLIPQNPSESLNPARKVGSQLQEALLPLRIKSKERKRLATDLLAKYGFDDVKRVYKAYPCELSGGMQQRVLCAIGAACSPEWVLADEPTKGLDTALCNQVRDNLLNLKNYGVKSMIVITHDINLAKGLCDVIAVMYAGQIVESGNDVLNNPLHPYTKAFFNALPENNFTSIEGVAPAADMVFVGCRFADRCEHATTKCRTKSVPQFSHNNTNVRCFLYE